MRHPFSYNRVPMPHARAISHPADARDPGVERHLFGWLAYVAFVVYGSLVPLDFQPLPLDQAWATFKQIPMLQLGIERRADWVSNGVLYVPVGFLTVALFAERRTLLTRLPIVVGATLFCFALAVAVEFAQLYFPPRTVSLNDVVAECIGSVLGIVLAVYWSEWFREMLATLAGKLGQLGSRVLQAYAIGYVAFSFFPFDFLLSTAELAAKVDSDAWGWFLSAQSTDRSTVVVAAKLFAEALAVVPLGMILARWNVARRLPATRHAVLYGALLGLLIEVGQFVVFSAVSQGASLLTRAIGMYGGARLWADRKQLAELHAHAHNKVLTISLGSLYLLALAAVNGWFDHRWHGMAFAARTMAETRLLPFYYHYYTSEQVALLSLASVALMYSPLGVLAWLRRWSPALAFWSAALTASAVETSKLFIADLHPDPSNVLIGATTAWAVSKLLRRLHEASLLPVEAAPAGIAETGPKSSAPSPAINSGRRPLAVWPALAATLALTGWIVVDFPFRPLLLGVLLPAYAALLWVQPQLLWAAIPAAIPLFDLAPWSGRFYLDEFDFLIMFSLIIAFARVEPARGGSRRDLIGPAVGCLVGATLVLGTLRGMWPLALPDANSFNNYASPYNALRIARGALWALLLVILMHRFSARGQDIRGWFARGMVIGLAGTVAVVVWERAAFPGLLNFADVYRVTGPFSQMHTGGADIETYLTAALPFAVVLTVQARSLAGRLAGGLLLLGASYAIAVTFSRAGYAGFAVALVIACLTAALARLGENDGRFGGRFSTRFGRRSESAAPGATAAEAAHTEGTASYPWAAPLLLLVLAVAVALPIYRGSFAQDRIARIAPDLAMRQAHWADALAMRDSGLLTELFGMGIGRFPDTHYWRSNEAKAGRYRLEAENGNTFLRLGSGQALYVEQFVAVEPGRPYVLQMDIRSAQAEGGVAASLCEKLLLTSGRCVAATAAIDHGSAAWQRQQLQLDSGDVGSGSWLTRRPVKLSLYNTGATSVDIDNVQLLAADGEQLSGNGDFTRGLDRWFFAVDQDMPWHIWSMPVAIVFDLGWLGLAAFAALLGLGLTRTTRQAFKGDPLAGATLGSLLGVLVITTVDTIIDAPRFLLLLLLLTCVGCGPRRPRPLASA